ncbi:MAG: outer membrane beta-barrel protein [Steroidobacteraceae bacterium]
MIRRVAANPGDVGLVRRALGWDVFMGVRPLPYLGAEIGYLDFGSAHRHYYNIPTPYASNGEEFFRESADAPAAFAVGYLPFEPRWDLYLKAGVARLHKSWDAIPPALCDTPASCSSPTPLSSPSFPGDATSWDFAYGVGTQWKFGAAALRLEYERVNASGSANGGDPDLLSVGVSWLLF